MFLNVIYHASIDFCISIKDVLVDDTGVNIGETDIRIVKLSKVVLMDCLLELVTEALGDCLEDVEDKF